MDCTGSKGKLVLLSQIATWLETVELILYIAAGRLSSKQNSIPVRTKENEEKKKKKSK